MITFQKENIRTALNDIMKFLPFHHKEVKDELGLDPNFEHYLQLEENGMIVVFTIRGEENLLFGYQVFVVSKHLHDRASLQAYQDILYVTPSLRGRGFGERFILWCDSQLADIGVELVIQEVRPAKDFSSTLIRAGYKHHGVLYAKRLDKSLTLLA